MVRFFKGVVRILRRRSGRTTFFLIILMGLAHRLDLQAASIKIDRDPQLLQNKKLLVTVNLDPGETLLKSGIRFSIDIPGLIIKEWKAQVQSNNKYFSTFKRNKQVFEGTIPIELTLATPSSGGAEPLKKNLIPAIYMFAFIVDEKGSTKSLILTVPLFEKSEPQRTENMNSKPSQSLTTTLSSLFTTTVTSTGIQKKQIDQSKYVQKSLTERHHRVIKWLLLLFTIFVVCCLAITMVVNNRWRFEIIELTKRLMIGVPLLIFNLYVTHISLAFLLMLFLIYMAWYYLKDTSTEYPVLHYSKLILGALCGLLAVPSFVCFYVMRQEGFIEWVLGRLF